MVVPFPCLRAPSRVGSHASRDSDLVPTPAGTNRDPAFFRYLTNLIVSFNRKRKPQTRLGATSQEIDFSGPIRSADSSDRFAVPQR
jgi:hypothetical protein